MWRLYNILLTSSYQLLEFFGVRLNYGCLPHKEKNDYTIEDLGGFFTKYDDPIESISWDKYDYDQSYLNTCVFASGMLSMSNRYKVRFSARWLVKCAKRERMINGNGYSYLRAVQDVIKKYGLLPYKYMPDEVNMSWKEYSKWTKEDTELKKIAENYKCGKYWKVRSEKEAAHLLQHGYVLFTAGKWYTAMNQAHKYGNQLLPKGRVVGGHAYQCSGHKDYSRTWEVPQTFGERFGDKGKAWIHQLYSSFQYAVYANEGLTVDQLKRLYIDAYDGWIIRTKENNTCYIVRDGKKHRIKTMEDYHRLADKMGKKKLIDHDVLQRALDLIPEGLPNPHK